MVKRTKFQQRAKVILLGFFGSLVAKCLRTQQPAILNIDDFPLTLLHIYNSKNPPHHQHMYSANVIG